jgi:transcriptional regulator with XRE-family HTH domain
MRSNEAFAYSRSTGYFCSVTASTVRIDASNDKYKTKDKTRIMSSEIKARQSAKIRQLAEAAKLTGLYTLDELASALGIPRSTAWTIRNGGHKASGLSVSIIDRMLSAPKLPPSVRTTLLEYIAEKTSGLYGGNERQQRLFCVRLKDRK